MISRVVSAFIIGLLLSVSSGPANAQQSTRVAFGCCFNHSERQPVFDGLHRSDPEVFVFLGNVLDVDADDMDDMLEAYEVFNRFRGPKVLRRQSAVMSVWNLTDYRIDGHTGANNPAKHAVKNHFLTYWREPISSPRMFQEHGLAKSIIIGNEPQRVQVIVLDGRWNRDVLTQVGWFERVARSMDEQLGPYLRNPAGRLLGEAQWQWLAEQLQKPAEVRVLMSATPFYAPANGYDSWAMYSQEQQRLEQLLQELQPEGLVLAVGDRGFGEFSKVEGVVDYPLWQVTAGWMSAENQDAYNSDVRNGAAYPKSRYGQIEVLWRDTPELKLSLRDVDGRPLTTKTLLLPKVSPN